MTSELWNDVTGLDRIAAILGPFKPKRKQRTRRMSWETPEQFARRMATVRHFRQRRAHGDPDYQFNDLDLDPLPLG